MHVFVDTMSTFTGAWCANSVTSCLDSDINNTAFYSFKTIFCNICHKKIVKIIRFALFPMSFYGKAILIALS